MDDFWILARRVLRYRGLLAAAVLAAIVSAGGLGVGIVGVGPILEIVLEEGRSLPEIAAQFNQHALVGGRIPQAWIDALPAGKFTAVLWIVLALGVLTLVGAAANFFHAYFSLTIVERTIARLRRELFAGVVHQPLWTLARGGSSDAISRIVNDPQALGMGLTALLSKATAQLTKGFAALVAAFVIDWRLTLVSLIVAPLLYTVIHKLGKRIRRAARAALVSQAELYGSAAEAIQGLRVVKVHTNERYECGRFHRINKRVLAELLRVRYARSLASPLVEVLAIFSLGVLSLVAIKAIEDGELDPSDFILSLGALGVAGASLKPLTGLMTDIQQSAGAAARIRQMLGVQSEQPDAKSRPRLPRHQRSIRFENVRMRYPNTDHPAIDGVSIEIPHGQTVAFVGPNGCGKTSLLSLVPRLFDPCEGRVLVDDVDVSTVNLRSLRQQIGVVTQETVLFRQSVRDNIAYGAGGMSQERIIDAARRAHAHAFIAALPQGYDTVLGDQGSTLSGGQRQRIAIARAILRDPAILILDEATSMIDAESESAISQALAGFSCGRTCLIVAHRLSTVVSAARIVVMDAGRIVDQGTHAELMSRCGLYQQLVQHQTPGLG
ncbi:MAG: ABC transporter ATP-binding protein [Leptolyngbya sp. PLA3]|nr:MAG: ABC transporter ATP-binding protein [Cyanobacteria bacterium CYA]MCE7967820.1 ABC transporter ATP-binding protein [Leptolyngbya sp. PL-A3]